MPQYLAELYISRNDADGARTVARRARVTASEPARDAAAARFLRSIFVPDDETCFLFYEAASDEAVREAGRLAELKFDRVAETIGDPTTGGDFP